MSVVTRGDSETIIIVGAGPKALAIATKMQALTELGWQVPKLLVVDKVGVAAHWSGKCGYTDGNQNLGTGPEKDIGFPYNSECWFDKPSSMEVNKAMVQFSWQCYKVAEGGYSQWIDRGRPQPTHEDWAKYLCWVAERVQFNDNLVIAKVRSIAIQDNLWRVSCEDMGSEKPVELIGVGLVITGPGPARRVSHDQPVHQRIMDGASFWERVEDFRHRQEKLSFGVIGTGETAASVAVALVSALKSPPAIDIITPQGVNYSRGESFEENRLFSNPEPASASKWSEFDLDDRREFIQRTDRGVFSIGAKKILEGVAPHICTVVGKAVGIKVAEQGGLVVGVQYGNKAVEKRKYDYVIVAIGFDPLWFVDLLDQGATARLRQVLGLAEGQPIVRRKSDDPFDRLIGRDLAIENLTPRLHVPMLSAVAQGPGFPNLSCLGLLSDRILQPYATAPAHRK